MALLLELDLPQMRPGEIRTDTKRESGDGYVEIQTQYHKGAVETYDSGWVKTQIIVTEYLAQLETLIAALQAEITVFA